mmetsp:Transcript_11172/g.26424  ORF Transcript_11172/g.26424 Transcript_11172/m.26424 type:complete len:132 (-) Transcript_11172:59-454(-)
MGTCVGTRCCSGRGQEYDTLGDTPGDLMSNVLDNLRLSKADREKLRLFENKMKGTISELQETSEEAKRLQEENDMLKRDMKELEAENAALKAELEQEAAEDAAPAAVDAPAAAGAKAAAEGERMVVGAAAG